MSRRVFGYVLILVALATLQVAAALSLPWAADEPEFLQPEQVFELADWQQQADALVAPAQVADGYYVYRDSLKAEDAQGQPVALSLPPGTAHHDEFFGETRIFVDDELTLAVAAGTEGPLTLHWQGCADAGICYPPQDLQVDLPATVASASGGDGAMTLSTEAAPTAEDQAAASRLTELGPAMAALVFLGFGLLLAFTPCSLPMIPIVSSLVVGSRAGPARALSLSGVYVLTMAATYAAVGVAAGLAGANVQAALQSPWLLAPLAALFLLLALSLFGAFELQLPSALASRLDAAGRKRAAGSLGGASALGFLSALLVGPCMTAPLAGALLYIGQTGNAVMGGIALFALGLGMGLPLLAIAVFGARILPQPGAWMERVRVAFGYVMLGMAIYMLGRFLPGTVTLILWGALGLALAVGLVGWTHVISLQRRLGWSTAFAATLVGVWSLMMLAGAASGGDSALRPLQHLAAARTSAPAAEQASAIDYVPVKTVDDVGARLRDAGAAGQWTLIDFYADWCVSCHVNERNVFGNAEVVAQLEGVQVLRPDVTRNDDDDKALLADWQVLGPPTMILVGPDGQEARGQRMVGELSAGDFLRQLQAAGAAS